MTGFAREDRTPERAAVRLGGMAPDPATLPHARRTDWVSADGRLLPEVRADLRSIPSWKNAWTVLFLYVQTIAVITGAVVFDHPVAWLAAFMMMGRTHAQFASLMHEAAHRLLFTNKWCNDQVGNWLLGFPGFTSTAAYRRVHMAHHRQEFGPDEPDIPLYANYPVSTASLRRKLVRDITGQTGWKLLRNQLRGFRSPDVRVRRTLRRIIATQVAMLTVFWAMGHPWLYLFLWLLPYLTVWRVINRLRSIAEHGGLRADPDRRITTHSVTQHPLVRFYMVPYNIGFHLAHHVDPGVPFRRLPRYHAMLREAGYVDDTYEHRTYRSLWKELAGAA